MLELAIMAASIVPEEVILRDLKAAITAYEANKTEETKSKLASSVALALVKMHPELKNPVQLMKDVKEKRDWLNMKPGKQ